MKTRLNTLLALFLIGSAVKPECHAQNVPERSLQKTIHVFVALCDNDSQGIVPVPKTLGNGNDPKNNLYWGALYGTKAFLKRSNAWEFIAKTNNINENILERIVLKHRTTGIYLVADAYRGNRIKAAIKAFLDSAGGNRPFTLLVGGAKLGIYGNANLITYIGHNGLMDFNVECPQPNPRRHHNNAAIILACKSKPYFLPLLENLECRPLLLTTGFMAPEAYTLEAAMEAWLNGKSANGIRDRAAQAYNKYQKCGITGAKRLFYAEEE